MNIPISDLLPGQRRAWEVWWQRVLDLGVDTEKTPQ